MGNPTQTPNVPTPQAPPPPYQPRRRRSMAGPIVLITIGILGLMATMGVLNFQTLLYRFAHFWPVLLIMWGLVKIVEHYRNQREGYDPPRHRRRRGHLHHLPRHLRNGRDRRIPC